MKSNNNIIQFHNTHRINFGLIVFALIFVYVIAVIVLSSKESTIVGYQVKTGTLSENRIYTGIALRDEYPVYSESTGYVSLFVRDGERAAYNNLVYAIDETGKLSDLTKKDPGTEETSLSPSELNILKQEVMLFSRDFDESCFFDVKTFEKQISEDMLRLENKLLLTSIDEINSMHITDIVKFFYAANAGIVTYYQDGYEMKTSESLTEADFNKDNYEVNYVYNDDLLEAGSFVYKYTNNENWSICIFVPNEELNRLVEDEYVNVNFLRSQTKSWGRIHIANHFENGAVVELSFTNSMVSYADDRFVEVELLLEEDSGLKVPNSSIANNSFFLIDKNFITYGGNSSNPGVNRQVVSDKGEVTTKFTPVTVYKETDEEYYVSLSGLNIGDILYYVEPENGVTAPDQPLTFTVGKQGTLVGVYNINKGYADFKQIEILYSNDEYSIIKPNTATGLRAYDYIALDSSVVTDKDFVY